MLKSNRFFKVVSLVILVIFVHEQVGWTQEGRPVWTAPNNVKDVSLVDIPTKINVPYDIGEVNQAVINGGKDVIINIQDAHASLSSQHSIVSILDNLVTNYDVRLVALEGAEGYIDTSILKTFPDKRIRKETAEYLMKEGRMSAGEFFDATRDEKDIVLYGVEKDELYKKNVQSFREIMDERAEYSEQVKNLLAQFEALKEKVFSPEFKALNGKARMHREGQLGFADYWEEVKEIAASKKVPYDDLANVGKLLRSIEMEEDINFARANLERKKLIDILSDTMDRKDIEELVLRSILFKQNKMSRADYHTYLSRLADRYEVDAEGYKGLIKFTEYVSLYESIDIMTLFKEVAALEDRMRDALYRNSDERELYSWIRLTELVGNLYNVELSNTDCAYILKREKDLSGRKCVSFIKSSCKKYGIPIEGGYDAGYIFSGVKDALEFYRVAEKRNNALLINTLKRMKKEGKHVAALITGGYHTQGLTELMQKNKLSYLVVAPKFEKGKERPYIAILTNKKKPYQKLIETGKYQLAVKAYFEDMNEDKFVEAAIYALSNVVKEGGNWHSEAERWFREYSREHERLKNISEERIKESLSPEEFAKVLGVGGYKGQGQLRIESWDDTVLVARIKEDGSTYFRLDRGDGGVLGSPRVLSPRQGQKILAALDHAKSEREGSTERAADLEEKLARVLDEEVAAKQGVEAIKDLMADKKRFNDFASRFDYREEVEVNEVVKKLRAMPEVNVPEDWQENDGFRGAAEELTRSVNISNDQARNLIDKLRKDKEFPEEIAHYFVTLRKEITISEIIIALYHRLKNPALMRWESIPALKAAIERFMGDVKGMYRFVAAGQANKLRGVEGDRDRYQYTIIVLELMFSNIAAASGKGFDELIRDFNGTEERPARVLELGSGVFHPITDYFRGNLTERAGIKVQNGFSNVEAAAIDPRLLHVPQADLYNGNALKMDMFKTEEFDYIFAAQVFNPECYTQYLSLNEEFWKRNFPGEEMTEEKYYRKITAELFRVTKPGGEIYVNSGVNANEDFNRVMIETGFEAHYLGMDNGMQVFAKPSPEGISPEKRQELAKRTIARVARFLEEKLGAMEDALEKIPMGVELNNEQIKAVMILNEAASEIVKELRGDELYAPRLDALRTLLGYGSPGHIYDIPGALTLLLGTTQLIRYGKKKAIDAEYYAQIKGGFAQIRKILRYLNSVERLDISFFTPEGYDKEFISLRDWERSPPVQHREWLAYLFANKRKDLLDKVEYKVVVHQVFNRYILSVNVFNDMVRSGEITPEPEEGEMFERVKGFLTETDPKEIEEIGYFARVEVAAALKKPEAPPAHAMTIGIPAVIFGELNDNDISTLESIHDARIVILESLAKEGMLDELEKARRRYRCAAAVLVDAMPDTGSLANLIVEFTEEMKEKVFVLAHPEVEKLTPETISKIEDLPSLLRDIADRYLNVVGSLELATMSIYQMRVRNSYRGIRKESRMKYRPAVLAGKEAHYLVHYADGSEVLGAARGAIVPAGLEILNRREKMKVKRWADEQQDKFMIMAPEEVVTDTEKDEFKKKLMELWMLEGVVDADDIVILDRKPEGYTNGELFSKVQAMLPRADMKNTGFRVISGELKYDNEDLLQVNLDLTAASNLNQYEVFVNLLLTGNPGVLNGIAELRSEGGKLYIYLPQARPIDFEEEVRNYYEKYREVLIRA